MYQEHFHLKEGSTIIWFQPVPLERHNVHMGGRVEIVKYAILFKNKNVNNLKGPIWLRRVLLESSQQGLSGGSGVELRTLLDHEILPKY